MRGLVCICASVVLSIAPAWAQQASTDAAGSPSPAAQDPAPATHKSLSPIGQALDGLLREASRSQALHAAQGTPGAGKNAAARASEVDTGTTDESTPIEVAVH